MKDWEEVFVFVFVFILLCSGRQLAPIYMKDWEEGREKVFYSNEMLSNLDTDNCRLVRLDYRTAVPCSLD